MKKPGANNTKKRQSQNLSKYQPFTKSTKNSLKDGYSLLFDSVKEGILILDFETEKIIDANSSISDLTGFPPEFVIGKEIWDLNLFEDRKIYESTIKEIKKNGKTYIKEFPVFKQNGYPAKLEFISNVYSEGNLKLIQCNIRDTADKKKQISGNSETRFKQIAEGTRDLIWEVNLEGVYTYVNSTVSEILGYEPWELTGKKHFYDFYEPEKKEELKSQVFNRFSNRETIKNFITCNIHKKGHKIRLSTNGFPVFDDQNNLTGYRGVHTDITAKLESEEALRQSEAKTKTILEAISTGIMIVDPENHTIVDINAEGARLFGENKENIIGHKCHKFICPAEEGKCPVIDLKQLLDNSERNLINKKGEEIPVLKTATLIEIGGKKVLLENFTDITKRKRAEESIQLEKERYKAITNAIPDLVFRLDREGRYLDYKADENELAIQTENIIGRLNRDLMPPEFVSIVVKKFKQL